ncbi:MAG: YcaO-like family protein [Bacilli bacterium]
MKEIQKENTLYIIDFSYNFNVPVLMALIVNRRTNTITVNLGASPIFDIALERTLTELY